MHCPASVHLCEELAPEEETSEYAAEGTEAHSLAEWKLHHDILKDTKKRKPKGQYYSQEMEDATDYYRDEIIEIMHSAAGSPLLLVEQSYGMEPWIPKGFGTSDAVVIIGKSLHVIDLKYGKGVQIDAPNNSQLRCYAIGTLSLVEGVYDIDQVVTHIIQPRLDHVSEEIISVNDLKDWADNVLQPAAKAAWANSDEQHAGDWCRFCRIRAICREREKDALEEARQDFAEEKDPATLSDDEIGAALEAAEKLSKWLEDVKKYALDQLLEGHPIKGWKAVEGRSIRKYSDDLAVEKALEAAGYERAVITETKLLGISAMEKLVGKKQFNEICGNLIIKPAGKPTLVPASDKRPALSAEASAKEDFKEEK
jgi:hypothetical protein